MASPAYELPSGRSQRAPAAVVALAAISGITADAFLSLPLVAWWTVVLAALGLRLFVVARRPRAAAVVLAIGWGAAFAAWHQVSHAIASPEAERWLAEFPAGPLRVEARIIAPSWRQERSRTGLPVTCAVLGDVHVLGEETRRRPFGGRLRMVLENCNVDIPAGTEIRAVGRLSRPATAGNPGGFDFQQWLHRQGVVGLLRVETPEAVQTVAFRPGWWERLLNQRRDLRQQAVEILERSADQPTARVAEALLLGTRQQMSEELREAFVESGTLHVLAISGVNVGVIWLGLMRLCRLLGWSLRTTGVVVMASLVAYAWLTDANPPIVRAVSMVLAFQAAELLNRRIGTLQGLALAVCVVLVANPQDLFNAGAQLSFLSVAALSAAQRLGRDWREDHGAAAPSLGQRLWSGLLRANLATGMVWIATLPLVLWKYHLVSFVGFVLNVLLGPLVCVLLWSGYIWLLCAPFSSWLSEIPLRVFERLLAALIWITQVAADWRCSHAYVAGPPLGWVLGYYALLFAAAVARHLKWSRWLGHGLLAWINGGLAWNLWAPAKFAGLACEVLAVGHGLAVVCSCPNGRTFVYDAGSLIGPDVAAEAVCGSLWRHGQRQVDALVASHADADHINGVSKVADRLVPGMLLVHRTFLDFSQPIVSQAIESWTTWGGSCRLIAAGDRIVLDRDVTIEVWHPAAAFRGRRDNANSLVVCLEYAGRRVLLTGDLESEGLTALLGLPRQAADLLIAPHHGARAANPPALGAWVNPTWVAISAADRTVADRLSEVYPSPIQRLNTAVGGMIRCEIAPDGAMDVYAYRGTRLQRREAPSSAP
uniref:ComEC family competence protein n=1 Tax=Schlesneria paludicola TaxID=360056 RepID=A0A7C4QQD9_9PLAN